MPQADQTSFLAGKILLAMPGLGDPRFHKAVIFICAHDKNGAMGLVINQMQPGLTFKNLLKQLDTKIEINNKPEIASMPVYAGGPVENSRGFLLHTSDFAIKDTIRVDDQFSVTGTIEALKKVAEGEGPEKKLFILGYAGWTKGQLEQEIQDNAWLITEPVTDIIFHDKPEEKWDMATRKMGIDPALLSHEAGHA